MLPVKISLSKVVNHEEMTVYLLNAVSNVIAHYQDLLCLTKADSPCNSLSFDARIPLGLYYENAIDGLEVQSAIM